jgi:hypothetical protein
MSHRRCSAIRWIERRVLTVKRSRGDRWKELGGAWVEVQPAFPLGIQGKPQRWLKHEASTGHIARSSKVSHLPRYEMIQK